MPRDEMLKLLKAESLWRAGVQSTKEIADEIGVGTSTLYRYAMTYHWPKRDDLAKLSAEAVRQAHILAVSMRAKDAVARLRAARDSSNALQGEERPGGAQLPEDDSVADLNQERGARPMSEQDAQRAVVIEQAASAAVQDEITSMYVEAISKILNRQQQLATKLADHVNELVDALKAAWDAEKIAAGKTLKPKDVRASVAAQVAVMKQLISMAAQAVVLERRVWMLDAQDGAGGGGLNQGDEGGVPVPTQRGTYEDFVRQAEASGKKLTR